MLHALIMAGGSGTRFWPASRADRPKQLLALVTDAPLLRVTFDRISPLLPVERIWVVTTRDTAASCRTVLPELAADHVIEEPVGRNTAACAGLAGHVLLAADPEAVCVVLPADHVIGDEERFRTALVAGADMVAERGGLLTFGIRPVRPETGYGYLKIGSAVESRGGWTIHRLDRFVEKPDAEQARRYIDSKDYLWNSGMFAWRCREVLDEIERQIPDLGAGLRVVADRPGEDPRGSRLDDVYPSLPATSIDFGIMEGARHCWTIPVDFPWSDVGSWSALGEILGADAARNTARGRVVTVDAQRNVVIGDGPMVAVVGVSDLVVVATSDAVLVVPAERAQEVKDVVAAVRAHGWNDVL